MHDETVRCINAGKNLEQTVRAVKLPDELKRLPYLRQAYGKVHWAVRGIFRQYTGWYSLNPTDLNANPQAARHRELLWVCGGPAPLLNRAEKALRDREEHSAFDTNRLAQKERRRSDEYRARAASDFHARQPHR